MVMRRTDVFRMPPVPQPVAADPNTPIERNIGRDVVKVLQACSEYIAQSHTKMKEFEMKISELSSKVDELITVAKDAKNSQGVPASAPEQPDDPQVQEMADRIDAAIKVLKGEDNTGVGSSPAPSPVTDPNAPINPSTGLPPPPVPA